MLNIHLSLDVIINQLDRQIFLSKLQRFSQLSCQISSRDFDTWCGGTKYITVISNFMVVLGGSGCIYNTDKEPITCSLCPKPSPPKQVLQSTPPLSRRSHEPELIETHNLFPMESPTSTPTPTPTPPTPTCWSNIVQKPPVPKPKQEPINKLFGGSCKSIRGIAVAVVDANAIIQGGDELRKCADKLVSIGEVIAEVKDPASRHNLVLMLDTVENMEPTPEALKTVVNFARETGDLQTLSDVDLKLIALTYTLEAQLHGTKHLRDSPPPVHMVNVKRLEEKDMPGWGSNVPNLEEWEALEHVSEANSNSESRILPLKDLNLNVVPVNSQANSENGSVENCNGTATEDQDINGNLGRRRRYKYVKREINIEGKKMVADGIDASQGQVDDNASDWLPAVSRSTHRRFLRRKARRELSEASERDDEPIDMNMETEGPQVTPIVNEVQEDSKEEKADGVDLSTILKNMRLKADSSNLWDEERELNMITEIAKDNSDIGADGDDDDELCDEEFDHPEMSSQTNESVDTSLVDDTSSEQSWMLRSLSESSVACVTGDFAMQNVILQMGLRLLAPGGMQIRQLHRWILKCHACNKITAEIGRIFCPKCGNGGTLRKVAVTVGENGVILAARRPRITLRGTKFSLPKPQGGRDAITKNLILREDQLPHKVLYPKKKANKQGDDQIFSSDYIFGPTADKKAPLKPPIRKALAVFSGKRNPNDNHYSRAKH